MQFRLNSQNVLEMREDHSQDWQPVPVDRFVEAVEAVGVVPARHAESHSGSLGVKVIPGGDCP